MPGHDIIVIGASSGGVEVLSNLASRLPASLPAALFVVLHVRPDAPSLLPAILNRAGALPAAHAVDGEPIRTGRIYVAPPGMQTYLRGHRLSVERGPRENLHRPAIDPLFRTAAHYYGPRVIGVIVSGALDDGTAGLQSIKEAGGLALVQDPSDALCGSMPAHALDRVAVDYCVPAVEFPDLLVRLASEAAPESVQRSRVPLETREESEGAQQRPLTGDIIGIDSGLTCPECSGILREVRDGEVLRFRCRVGHAYTSQTMLEAQGDSVEKALWTAVRSLEERSVLMRKLADSARARGRDPIATLFEDRERALLRDVQMLRAQIARGRALEPVTPETA
jgi:two-component system, chemotaxis family, protein-glutamate methylesterase/glutaminase